MDSGWRRRIPGGVLAALLLCAATGPMPGDAQAQAIHPMKQTIAKLYGNIVALITYLDVCRVHGGGNAADFAGALDAYKQEVAPVLARIDVVLRGVMKSEGDAAADPTPLYDAADEAALGRIRGLQKSHPDEFTVLCGGLLKIARERRLEFAPLRERFPDEMQALDDWK